MDENPFVHNTIGAREAASILNVSPGHIKNLCAQGKVVSKKIGKTWVIDRSKLRGIQENINFICMFCGYKEQLSARKVKYKDGLRCKQCECGGAMIDERVQNKTTKA
ncbi:helix-turn-helix domain-containing protein [Bacillus thuringiensis]|uniref:Prophage LambdaBa04, DNA binding protein n=1 Tax=Bacillus thuringiensis HD-771 TaxID=1218175 RepID=A0A9W3JN67_BACTU|nr:helix-turn-helix domain-containing protein [Bacillus thuringiensis]AFQ19016.1 Prophage LambdaBa04, DNA binding protein [Bacillus thuringiensis HD-771]MEB4891967.1 helix-turn-helix domain-containing protein [Bacillus thuringiensis]MEC2474238.1 helix-turn-helix domain-containing protein [Bacillus thuringiensis]MEC2560513.1 helix-turn-helix domain-containing protein [Bacillus thuringiensis]MEC2641392.1 helix-turn-helix domain-containing protein [Bacillus thuringiensis]